MANQVGSRNFRPVGGTCVVSCFNVHCEEMRKIAQASGHAVCVTFIEDDFLEFADEYFAALDTYAKNASLNILITGNDGEKGKTQCQEEKIMEKRGIGYKTMTFEEYKSKYTFAAGTTSTPGTSASGHASATLAEAATSTGTGALDNTGPSFRSEAKRWEKKLNVVCFTYDGLFSKRRLGDDDAVHIADALKNNITLEELQLASNNIADRGAVALAEALKTNTVLTHLYLPTNRIGDEGAAALADALKTNTVLLHLELQTNRIGGEGAVTLADALKTNTVLWHAELHNNSIGDQGAAAMAEALKTNATLKFLGLGRNKLSKCGAMALKEARKQRNADIEIDGLGSCVIS